MPFLNVRKHSSFPFCRVYHMNMDHDLKRRVKHEASRYRLSVSTRCDNSDRHFHRLALTEKNIDRYLLMNHNQWRHRRLLLAETGINKQKCFDHFEDCLSCPSIQMNVLTNQPIHAVCGKNSTRIACVFFFFIAKCWPRLLACGVIDDNELINCVRAYVKLCVKQSIINSGWRARTKTDFF